MLTEFSREPDGKGLVRLGGVGRYLTDREEIVDWIKLAQDSKNSRALLEYDNQLWSSTKRREILTSCATGSVCAQRYRRQLILCQIGRGNRGNEWFCL